jgi:hypothetical protein
LGISFEEGNFDRAIHQALALIRIYDELDFSSKFYRRTYSDLFQLYIPYRKGLESGMACLRKALEAALAFSGDEEDDFVKKFQNLMADPTLTTGIWQVSARWPHCFNWLGCKYQ